jgi:hypothetical protein
VLPTNQLPHRCAEFNGKLMVILPRPRQHLQ